jgi:large subunit ribosomal protein L23
MKPQDIILAPIITERSIAQQSLGKYSFEVNPKANKSQIAAAFTSVFNLKPLQINTSLTKAKSKMDWRKRLQIKASNRKIAVITLDKNQKIELLSLKSK